MLTAAPQGKNYLPQNLNSADVEKSWRRCQDRELGWSKVILFYSTFWSSPFWISLIITSTQRITILFIMFLPCVRHHITFHKYYPI